jgi:hypothetical protein
LTEEGYLEVDRVQEPAKSASTKQPKLQRVDGFMMIPFVEVLFK